MNATDTILIVAATLAVLWFLNRDERNGNGLQRQPTVPGTFFDPFTRRDEPRLILV